MRSNLFFEPQPTARPSLSVVLLTVFLISGPIHAFSLASLNCLHLGWGNLAYQTQKEAILQDLFANYDVVLLQEVMRQADLTNVTPGNHFFLFSDFQGPGTYKEGYGFLVRTTLDVAGNAVFHTDHVGFSRPPAGILVGENGNWTWVVNYHAIFGRSIWVRRLEVSQTQEIYQDFQMTAVNGAVFDRVVIGGDWNLRANDRTFLQFVLNNWSIDVQPTGRTSLKRNGRLSQSYDHFLWDTTVLNINQTEVIPVPNPPGSRLRWRQRVSDHLGIAGVVN